MIAPTVGRVVWFRPSVHDEDMQIYDPRQPCNAQIVFVWNDRLVNLAVHDHTGKAFERTSVPLLQDDDHKPEAGYFACWMPYQKGQAAKAEALEQKLGHAPPHAG